MNLLVSVERDLASACEQNQRSADFVDWERSADVVVCDRILGHRAVLSLGRLLYEAQAALGRDMQEALHSVVATPGQDDGDHA